jgi:hypothetical protein
MGAVYRARDTKLDRDVAINVLPETLAEARLPSGHRQAASCSIGPANT